MSDVTLTLKPPQQIGEGLFSLLNNQIQPQQALMYPARDIKGSFCQDWNSSHLPQLVMGPRMGHSSMNWQKCLGISCPQLTHCSHDKKVLAHHMVFILLFFDFLIETIGIYRVIYFMIFHFNCIPPNTPWERENEQYDSEILPVEAVGNSSYWLY